MHLNSEVRSPTCLSGPHFFPLQYLSQKKCFIPNFFFPNFFFHTKICHIDVPMSNCPHEQFAGSSPQPSPRVSSWPQASPRAHPQVQSPHHQSDAGSRCRDVRGVSGGRGKGGRGVMKTKGPSLSDGCTLDRGRNSRAWIFRKLG